MIKRTLAKIAVVALMATSLTGCFRGERVEIPTAFVGKVQTAAGFEKGKARNPSKFRLSHCGPTEACERLVILDVSDNQYTEDFLTYMPVDQLNMGYRITMTLAIDPEEQDGLFQNVPFREVSGSLGVIEQARVYKTYAQPILQTKIPAVVSQLSIGKVSSNLDAVNAVLLKEVGTIIKSETPFRLKHIGMVNPKYPDIITRAKELAKEREAALGQVKAKKELELAEMAAEKELEAERRAVQLMKAKTDSMIADAASDRYVELKRLEVLESLANSDNKAFIPVEMFDQLMIKGE